MAMLTLAPGAAGAQVGGGDSVVGSGSQCFGAPCPWPNHVAFGVDARSGPRGESPSGSVSWFRGFSATTNFGVTAEVTCLGVVGSVAVVGFAGETFEFAGTSNPVAGFVRVIDAGGSNTGLDSFATTVPTFISPPPPPPGPTDCSAFPTPAEEWVNEQGDLVVVDAHPMPTLKQECKNGGWKAFGDAFKNQGQCVAFVERGPGPH